MFLGLAASKCTLYVMWNTYHTVLVTINDGLFICCCSVLDFTGQRCSISRGGSLWIMTLYQQTYCSAYWAPPICSGLFHFIAFLNIFISSFPASCRELQLASCILSISATNLFTAAENCCELVSAEESSDIRFLSSHSDTFFEVLSLTFQPSYEGMSLS